MSQQETAQERDSLVDDGDPAAPVGESDNDAPERSGVLENRLARAAALVAFAALSVWLTVTGAMGVLFALLVVVPLIVAMALAQFDMERPSIWARVVTVLGLIAWLASTGGLPMLLVVAAVVAMIFLHELGHYMAARRAGMLVTEFFLGFGTKLWSFRRGDTEYGIKAIPAGAYVKIVGMNNLEEVDPALEPRTYRQAPFRSRFSVAVAGSAMHFALALVLLVVQFALIGRVDDKHWSVSDVTSQSAASDAGIRAGDRIVAFDGRSIGDFDEFRRLIKGAPSGAVQVQIERDGREQSLDLHLNRRAKIIGTVGSDVDVVESSEGLVVGPVAPGSRAERAGLHSGQQIVTVNGTAVSDLDDVRSAVRRVKGGEFTVGTQGSSGGRVENATVDLGSAVDVTDPTAFFGVGAENDLRRESLPAALGSSVSEFGRGVGTSVVGIATVFSPPRLMSFLSDTLTGSQRDVADKPTPAEDVAVSSDASRPTSIIGAVAYGADLTGENLANLVAFLIMLNIFIGVFNLIPLLPFDGGHLAIAVYEKAREIRRRSNKRYISDVSRMIPVAYAVVMVLVVVGLLAMYLDITQGVAT